jgi:aminoglycoside phosphotransferase (APT) family kinase protein
VTLELIVSLRAGHPRDTAATLKVRDASVIWFDSNDMHAGHNVPAHSGALGRGAVLGPPRRLSGGTIGAVHAIPYRDAAGSRRGAVLKRYDFAEEHREAARHMAKREAEALTELEGSHLPVARLIAIDADGRDAGCPATLVTRLPGRMQLKPHNLAAFVATMAGTLVELHRHPVGLPARDPWALSKHSEPPAWARDHALWSDAIAAASRARPAGEAVLAHGDYQHFNMLWSDRRLTGIVDWGSGGAATRAWDVGHCRLNLAILFGPDAAERFLALYESLAAVTVDPAWDLVEIVKFLPGWWPIIRAQVGRRRAITEAEINSNVEALVRIIMRRL